MIGNPGRFGGLWASPVRLFLIAGVGLLTPQLARATETEVREFTIQVDGKTAGQYVMTITKQNDGTLTMAAQAGVRIKLVVANYTYSFQGTEVWKDGRLVQMKNTSDDNGKRSEVSAAAEGNGLRLRVNGKDRTVRGDVWTTSYWKLADAKYHNKDVPLLEPDSGKEINGKLQYVGVEPVTLGGKAQNCYRFRVTGGPSPVDLWYDGLHRLVRQEFTEEGHRTVFLLTGLRR